VAAIGRDAEELCKDHWKAETAHAHGTPYYRIAEKGGYVCLLGVDQDRNTTLHTAEALLRLPYLTTETRTFGTPEGNVTRSWPFFPGQHRDFIGLDPMFRKSGKMKVGRIGQATVRLIKSRDLIDLAVEAGRDNPAFVLCTNPNCPDCVSQRARIRKAAFASETFKVVASATLAGEFPDQIAARLTEAGVGAVELDGLQGRPLSMLPAQTVVEAIARFRQLGIEVASLRTPAVSQRAVELMRLARAQSVPRVVMPLSHKALEFQRDASEARVSISFYNADLDSDACSEILVLLGKAGAPAGFTFNGPAFARAGELPFLVSYKKKLRRYVDQLDVADGTYDGRAQPLACGNAEVKEMISILRSAGFTGTMSLSAGNCTAATLGETAARFETLLKQM